MAEKLTKKERKEEMEEEKGRDPHTWAPAGELPLSPPFFRSQPTRPPPETMAESKRKEKRKEQKRKWKEGWRLWEGAACVDGDGGFCVSGDGGEGWR